MSQVVGDGNTDTPLSEQEVVALVREAFASRKLDGRRVLCIIPDHSRTAPIDLMFRVVYEELAERVALLDFIVALGTHPPMSDGAINHRVGIAQEDRSNRYPKARFFNHFAVIPLFAARQHVENIEALLDKIMFNQRPAQGRFEKERMDGRFDHQLLVSVAVEIQPIDLHPSLFILH